MIMIFILGSDHECHCYSIVMANNIQCHVLPIFHACMDNHGQVYDSYPLTCGELIILLFIDNILCNS